MANESRGMSDRTGRDAAPARETESGAGAVKPKLVAIWLNYQSGNDDLWVELDPKDIKGMIVGKQEIQAILDGKGKQGPPGKPPGAGDPSDGPCAKGTALARPDLAPPDCCYFVNGEWICW